MDPLPLPFSLVLNRGELVQCVFPITMAQQPLDINNLLDDDSDEEEEVRK